MKSSLAFAWMIVVTGVLPLPLLAGGGEPGNNTEESVSEENSFSGIIHNARPIIGYQPLTVAGQEIDATYLEERLGKQHGAIILLHDNSDSIEDQGVVTPLRHILPEYGWSTLSLALSYPFEPRILLSPTLENTSEAAAIPEGEESIVSTESEQVSDKEERPSPLPPVSNQQRIEAAITFLTAKGIDRIIILGHGKGGTIAVGLFDKITSAIAGLVLVGTLELSADEEITFSVLQKPILDIYGDNDLAGVEQAVLKRKVVMKRGINKQYVMRKIVGADHFFTGLEATLVATIRGWLNTTFIEPKTLD